METFLKYFTEITQISRSLLLWKVSYFGFSTLKIEVSLISNARLSMLISLNDRYQIAEVIFPVLFL